MRDERFPFDPLLPREMARKAETVGIARAEMDTFSLLALAVLAGAFIAFGAVFMTVTLSGASGLLPFGLMRMLGGVAFSLGVILVAVGGGELFAANNLMAMAWASGAIRLRLLMRAWSIVYAGNFIGAAGTAFLVFLSGHFLFGNGSVGRMALAVADGKCAIPLFRALLLGILCNLLICLAVWLSYSARTVIGKIAAIVPPISAFVAAGFEHSVANMYLIPAGLLVKWFAGTDAWSLFGATPADFPALTLGGMIGNLVAVTIGNMIGGGLVAMAYWCVYLRRS
jgi:formate transporter